jgi:acetyl esterase
MSEPRARDLGPQELRSAQRLRVAARPPGPPLAEVADADVLRPDGGIVRTRCYLPEAAVPGAVAVYVHGGGFVIGDLDSHDRFCRRLAGTAGVRVVAVDVRRAPEHPWPASVDDVLAVARAELATGARVVLAADSSGAAVAVLVATALRAEPLVPCGLLLVTPFLDLTLASARAAARDLDDLDDVDDLDWFAGQWVPEGVPRDAVGVAPAAVPGLPPTVVVAAERDVLRAEAVAFANALAALGVASRVRVEPSLGHGFVNAEAQHPEAVGAVDRLGADLTHLVTRT